MGHPSVTGSSPAAPGPVDPTPSRPAATRVPAEATPTTTLVGLDDLASRLAAMAYRRPFRRYQAQALAAFEQARAAGSRRSYLVLPPGGGKTVLGLEVARRLGRPTVVLGPNTAIQAQWLRQWLDFGPGVLASADPDVGAPFTVLTYQALCILDPGSSELDELGEWTPVTGSREGAANRREAAADRARRRRLIARGGDADRILALVHPNGRALMERIRAIGPSTLILDECHHLLEMWGTLLGAVLDTLGHDVFVLGLTATPPEAMAARERELHDRLFGGPPDFEVPTPALVKEGDLAPYQELVLLTEPLPAEAEYVETQERRFQELVTALLDPAFASLPFINWLDQRIVRRVDSHGSPISWTELRRREPELAVAALRLLSSRSLALPEGAALGEAERRPPTADDWALLLGAYCVESVGRSDEPRDRAAWERIRAALPPLGYVLTLDGVRRHASPVDRVLALSASKFAAALTILDAECAQLGEELRAVLLCDYETTGVTAGARLRGVLDPDAGSAALLLQVLLADPMARKLDPILVTGRSVACSPETAAAFQRWASEKVPELAGTFGGSVAGAVEGAGAASTLGQAVTIEPATGWWRPRTYLPLVTRYFETGRSRCLVGTRGLLGEGWDAHRVNVLVDLTMASTATTVHQLRGRSLRLDAAAPHKVADNWDVVCVMPDQAKGAADYARFVRKHRSYFALTATGEVESGVSHVDARLSPFGPPARERFAELDAEMLLRPSQRAQVHAAWRVGEPYQDRHVTTLRVRPRLAAPVLVVAELEPGAPGTPSAEHEARRLARWRVGTAIAGGAVVVAGGAAAGELVLGLAGAGAALAGGTAWASGPLRILAQRLLPRDALDDLALALLTALRTLGEVPPEVGAGSIRLVPQADGYYRCYLADVPADVATVFAVALDELVGPLAAPRYLVRRYVVTRPIGLLGGAGLAARAGLRRPLARQAAYHAVPDLFSTSHARLSAFVEAWARFVSPGPAISTREALGAGLLELHRGEEPYARETQVRTLWC